MKGYTNLLASSMYVLQKSQFNLIDYQIDLFWKLQAFLGRRYGSTPDLDAAEKNHKTSRLQLS